MSGQILHRTGKGKCPRTRFFPVLYSCRNLYFPTKHEFAFSPSCLYQRRKWDHHCSRLPREKKKDKMLNRLIVKISHYPWCNSPLEKHGWVGTSQLQMLASSPLEEGSSEYCSQWWCSLQELLCLQPPFWSLNIMQVKNLAPQSVKSCL